MKIIYVAKHNSGGGDDEGAIEYALTELGHNVICIQESKAADTKLDRLNNGDLLLYHKWNAYDTIREITIPKVSWYFDLVEYPDVSLENRNENRRNWMRETVEVADLIFCTDGDWVVSQQAKSSRKSHKYVWLTQGYDSRQQLLAEMNFSSINNDHNQISNTSDKILFTGILRGGQQRAKFVEFMKSSYPDRFLHMVQGCYGQDLYKLINSVSMVVAPWGPVGEYYWSNRIYTSIGMGAFLLHPYTPQISKEFDDSKHLRFYVTKNNLRDLIHRYTEDVISRESIRQAGKTNVLNNHTYLHRCTTLISNIKDRILK